MGGTVDAVPLGGGSHPVVRLPGRALIAEGSEERLSSRRHAARMSEPVAEIVPAPGARDVLDAVLEVQLDLSQSVLQ